VGRALRVAGRVEGAQAGTLEVNGASVPLDADGSFVARPVLADGEHEIVVRYRPEEGEPVTAKRTVRIDTTAPVLSLETKSGRIEGPEVVVRGRVEDANPAPHVWVRAAAAPLRTWGDDGRVDLTAWLEPVDLAPGETGTFVVAGRGPEALRFVPVGTGDADAARFVFEPLPGPGVTYKTPEVEWTDGGGFSARIPVTLAKDASKEATIGGKVTYRTEGDGEAERDPVTQTIGLCLGRAGAACAADVPRTTAPVETPTARVSVRIERSDAGKVEAVVRIEPKPGYRLFREATEGRKPIAVKPRPEGVVLGERSEVAAGGPVAEAVEVRQPFTRKVEAPSAAAVPGALRLDVSWQACDENDECQAPETQTLEVRWIGEPEEERVPIGEDGSSFALPVRVRPGEEVILEIRAEDTVEHHSEPVIARWWRAPAGERSASETTPPETVAEPTPGKSYAIRAEEDHLAKIAAKAYGDAAQWVRIWFANLSAVPQPDQPPSGTVIWIPER
jgi:nucleoid-associated protein YgaU